MSGDDLLAEYTAIAGELVKLESQVDALKSRRSEAAKALFERDGKGHVYEVGGVPMLVVTSKTGTYFFTPKDKWRRKKGEAKGKPKKRRVIVGEQVVELEEGQPDPAPRRRVEVKATLRPSSGAAMDGGSEPPPEPPPGEGPHTTVIEKVPPKAEEPAPEPKKPDPELDPLEAALAELDLD